jgi:transcription initiation factor TFIIB
MGDNDVVDLNECEIWKQLERLKCTDAKDDLTSDKAICKCGSDTWDSVGDELYCCKCFTVLFKNIDSQAEWRFYGASDNKTSDPSRCGLPINQFTPTSAMGTLIGVNDNSSASSSNENFYQYNKMRKYHLWNSMPYRERSLYNILNTINLQAGSNGLTQTIIDDAKLLYSKLSSDRITRGNNRSGLIASSIYMSCKSNNVPRSAKEIAKMFNLNITTMTKGCKHFNEIMKDVKFECSKPSDFIRRFLSKLKRMNLYDVCMHVEKKSSEFSLVTENAPPSIAAAIIYLVAVEQRDKNLTKKTIAKTCEISEVTINKVYKKLTDFVEFIMP